jgi:hypothetical protein
MVMSLVVGADTDAKRKAAERDGTDREPWSIHKQILVPDRDSVSLHDVYLLGRALRRHAFASDADAAAAHRLWSDVCQATPLFTNIDTMSGGVIHDLMPAGTWTDEKNRPLTVLWTSWNMSRAVRVILAPSDQGAVERLAALLDRPLDVRSTTATVGASVGLLRNLAPLPAP